MKRFGFAALLFACSLTSFAQKENWYWGFGMGPSASVYSGSLSGDTPGLNLDLGFYWPVGDGTTILGVSDFAFGNLDATAGTLAFSASKTFGTEPGNGWFIRGDGGFGRVRTPGYDTWGFGLAGTVGYGVPVSEETRLLFQLRAHTVIGTRTLTGFSFCFGPMF